MKPYEVIQKINQAMCDDDLEAAEKALEDYVLEFGLFMQKYIRIRNGYIHRMADIKTAKVYMYDEMYKLFTNQSKH